MKRHLFVHGQTPKEGQWYVGVTRSEDRWFVTLTTGIRTACISKGHSSYDGAKATAQTRRAQIMDAFAICQLPYDSGHGNWAVCSTDYSGAYAVCGLRVYGRFQEVEEDEAYLDEYAGDLWLETQQTGEDDE